ncbi:hypothetical protein AcetOrient_orf00703 [Acetobacter orientalis]|uniref:Uncharacterized protein n=1 Tax=Acetobacter orientalis TaxID=146474 RepID=A0A2Z5ZEL1_9PROT|nr:hypothetical protein AcetOrient_orf00703 [Acetobacter orientalis]
MKLKPCYKALMQPRFIKQRAKLHNLPHGAKAMAWCGT